MSEGIWVAIITTMGGIVGIIVSRWLSEAKRSPITVADKAEHDGATAALILEVAEKAAARAAAAEAEAAASRADAAAAREEALLAREEATQARAESTENKASICRLDRRLAAERAITDELREYISYLLAIIREHLPGLPINPMPAAAVRADDEGATS